MTCDPEPETIDGMNLNFRILRLLRGMPFQMAITIFAIVAHSLFSIFQAVLLARILSGIFLFGETFSTLENLMTQLALVLTGRIISNFIQECTAKYTASRIKARLREDLVNGFLRQDAGEWPQTHPGELTSLVMEGVDALDGYISQYLPQVINAVALPLLTIIWIIPVDGLSGLVLLLTAPLIPIFMVLIGEAAENISKKQLSTLTRMSGLFVDLLRGLATLKAFGQSKAQIRRVDEINRKYRQATLQVLKISFLSALTLELVAALSTAVVAVEIGLRLLYGQFDYQVALMILLITPEYYQSLRQLSARFHASITGIAAIQRIDEWIKPELDSIHASEGTAFPLCQKELNLEGRAYRIHFRDVGYRYPGQSEPVIQGINLEIKKGHKVVLVGESGSGKTTILKLLLGLIEPQQGRIDLEFSEIEMSLQSIRKETWRKELTWVPAQGKIYRGTLLDNLRIANNITCDSQIIDILNRLNLKDWVEGLPKGLNTWLGEGGIGLSSGQVQRISLARAILHNPPLIVMDEPTAHLDPETDEIIRPVLREWTAGKTVIMAAHRIQSVLDADNILVVKAGKVVEQGAHSRLIDQRGAYFQLFGQNRGGL